LLAELLEFRSTRPADAPSYLNLLLVPLGAFDLLPDWAMLVWGPEYAAYRRSPQFHEYMRESGAVDYWREHGYPPQCRPLGAEDFACD
jgi:adenylate cyclase